MAFKAERIARQREKFEALSAPMREALRLRVNGAPPRDIGRRLGLTSQEARILLAAAIAAMGA